jgi:hypothetical protein
MHSGCPLAYPGDGVQPIPGLGEWGDHPVDLRIKLGD